MVTELMYINRYILSAASGYGFSREYEFMDIRYSAAPRDVAHYNTELLREEFVLDTLFTVAKVHTYYSHVDRVLVMGAMPSTNFLAVDDFIDQKSLGTDFLLQRRELGILNVGLGEGIVELDGKTYSLSPADCLYVGQGIRSIRFCSRDEQQSAKLYCVSTPAHCPYPTTLITQKQARRVELGEDVDANHRVIHQYIHPDVVTSCQLSLGWTQLQPGSVWNTMPAHTHERRMEVYLYLELADQVVFHFMGEPQQTRHLVMRNEQAVISPSWSIHSGCGTKSYSFVWAMAGENQTFDDMDHIQPQSMR